MKNQKVTKPELEIRNPDCPECLDSEDVFDHGEAENKRTYDDKMHIYECEDCGVLWKE